MNQFFVLSPEQVQIKETIKNNKFIRLEIYAISDALPNNNGSHFTLEAMRKGLDSFVDKPILGFFNKSGDFETHNGKESYDPELQSNYWDNEEQILGFIREKDEREIVYVPEDKLNWIKLSAIVYTQYNYKQIKRLLKDKKKKVSVEIEILRSERIGDILYIYEFELLGITILGSKNGVPIKEGIEGAHLSVSNSSLNGEIFNNQKQALAFAYAEYEQNSNKGEEEKMNDASFEELLAKCSELEQTCKNSEEKCAELEAKCEDMTAKCAESQEKCEALEKEKEELSTKCSELETKCASVEEECNTYKSKCAEVEEKYNESCAKYAKIESEYAETKKALFDLTTKEFERHIAELNARFGLSSDEMDSLSTSCKEGKFSSVEDIDKVVAYMLFTKKETNSGSSKSAIYEIAIPANPTPQEVTLDWRERLAKNKK